MNPEASERSKLSYHVSNRQRYTEHQPLVNRIDQSECLDFEDFTQFSWLDDVAVLQSVVFLEDAFQYRSIDHKVDRFSLHLHRHYHSKFIYILRWMVIFSIHILAFFEPPSSLTWTSDMRYRGNRWNIPGWLLCFVEFLCLLLLLADSAAKVQLRGRYRFLHYKWDVCSVGVTIVSMLEWSLSIGLNHLLVWRYRRMLRPYYIIQNSSLMKKIVNCLFMTLPQVISVLVLLLIHLYIFTLLGMLIFPTPQISSDQDGKQYFSSLPESFMSLLILLTTANNPNVTIPAYSRNRLYCIFFVIFLVIGLYCFWNMLTAIIYNQFRGYFLNSMQSSVNRRRVGVRASFEVLRHKLWRTSSGDVGRSVVKSVVEMVLLPQAIKDALLMDIQKHVYPTYSATDYQNLFLTFDMEMTHAPTTQLHFPSRPCFQLIQRCIIHKYFAYFGVLVAVCNTIVISVELVKEFSVTFTDQSSNFMAGEVYTVVTFGWPFNEIVRERDIHILWNVLRGINILIMARLLTIVPHITSMKVIAAVLFDLVSNMKAFVGILVAAYYTFAILGMELFHDTIKYTAADSNRTFKCGTYQQLVYWAINFDDFAASLVVLWDIMVVNNWPVFLEAYRTATSAWAYLYFVAWWMVSVIIVMNLFTAVIMENFIMKWDRSQQQATSESAELRRAPLTYNTVHDMFRGLLKEPSDSELLETLRLHPHLDLHLPFYGNSEIM